MYRLVLDIIIVFWEVLELYFMSRGVIGATSYELGVWFRYIEHNIQVLMVKQCYKNVIKGAEKSTSVE